MRPFMRHAVRDLERPFLFVTLMFWE
jgi:hypothetical protein